MKLYEIIEQLEQLSPSRFACQWDNVGLLVGRRDREIQKIGISLDATNEVIEQAIEQKVDLLLTHHPMIFSSMKRVSDESFLGRKILALAENKIACYAMHTNFDIIGGMAQLAEQKLELSDTTPLEVTAEENGVVYGIGSVGNLKEQMTVGQCAELVKKQFDIPSILLFGDAQKTVQKVAICPGSGRSVIDEAIQKGAEILITGDIGHHEGLDALDQGLMILDAGHYGLEHIFMDFMIQYIGKATKEVELLKIDSQCPFTVL